MSHRQTDLLILLWVHIVWLQELIENHIMWLERERVCWEEGERTKGWREKEVEKLSHTHTKQKQSKVSSCHKGHAYLAKPGHLCTKQVLCAGAVQSPGAGQGTHRRTNCASHRRCGHPKSHRRL